MYNIFTSTMTTPILWKNWDERSKFLTPVDPHSNISHLYRSIVEHFAKGRNTAYHRLLIEFNAKEPEELVKKLFVNPPTLIFAPGPLGVHFRAEHITGFIFINSDLWYITMCDDPMSPSAVLAHEKLKIAIVHELAHCLVSMIIIGTAPRLIYKFNPKDSELQAEDLAAVTAYQTTIFQELRTPEKIKVPWLHAWMTRIGLQTNEEWEGESGYWVELRVFGGLVYERNRRAYLQISATTSSLLTDEMLMYAYGHGIVNFMETFTLDLSPDIISPSPSISNLGLHKVADTDPELEETFCPGPLAIDSNSGSILSAQQEQHLLAIVKAQEKNETSTDV
ncbi:hypothetical protein GGX14DRAFT_557751 [Mycena pura]|uniref:Uncharacterized protein n=1 Tax=Mycena pura TaxID=153505 RepID=A0AAD6YLP4_9AGAR|nr:hypothetical protein GGX14DRAFT_557751 [Mycena pura]